MTKERDESVGRLLGDTLKARAAAEPAGACLDADTLAAWADDTLSRSDRAAVEAHAADCARCQAMLAAMVRTLPVEPARASWMPALGWLIPVTAVAAAVVVWVVVPQRAPVPARENPAAAVDQIARAPEREPDKATPSQPNIAPERRQAPPSRDPATMLDKKVAKQEATGQDAALATKAASPAAAPQAPAAPASSEVTVTGSSPAAMPRPSPPAPAAQSLAAAASPANAVTAFAARSRNAAAEKTASQASPAVPVIVVSSNPDSRWRILGGGAVEHTTDGGSTWQTQQTGVSVTLTAGASPSSSVCWLVGAGGIVTLSTDATTWRRIAFPGTADLVSVAAIDGRTATVTLADGRKLTTTDAGASWQ